MENKKPCSVELRGSSSLSSRSHPGPDYILISAVLCRLGSKVKTQCSAGLVLWFTHSLSWLQSTVNQTRLPNHATCPMEKKGFELCLGKRKMSASMRSRAPVESEKECMCGLQASSCCNESISCQRCVCNDSPASCSVQALRDNMQTCRYEDIHSDMHTTPTRTHYRQTSPLPSSWWESQLDVPAHTQFYS